MAKRKPGTTLVDGVHLVLREAIMSGDLEPGSKLSISGLATAQGVSLSVMREALTRLVADGLALSSAMLGFRVMDISEKDLLDLGELRLLLLSEAARQSIAQGDIAWEARLLSANHMLQRALEGRSTAPESVKQTSLAVFDFERALISGCPNARLTSVYETTFQSLQIYHRLSLRLVFDQYEVYQAELGQVVEYAIARKPDAVIRILQDQARRVGEICVDYLRDRARKLAA